MSCRWRLHKWSKWTAENTTWTNPGNGTTYIAGVQWRQCQRCNKRQQVRL